MQKHTPKLKTTQNLIEISKNMMKKEGKIYEIKEEAECNVCSICIKIHKELYYCKGSCRKPFCHQCLLQYKRKSKNQCPNKCQAPFYVESPQPELVCPFNPKECNISINSVRDLNCHFQVCLAATPEQRIPYRRRYYYLCNLQHRLNFISIEIYQFLYKKYIVDPALVENCNECGVQVNCYTVCLKCSCKQSRIFFCLKCRPLPCSQYACPNNHQLIKYTRASKKIWCDFCILNVQLISTISYSCRICQFDCCFNCYQSLPFKNQIILNPIDYKVLVQLAVQGYQESASISGSDYDENEESFLKRVKSKSKNK